MEQFEQLLTCCVCLDRYRNPKLLPCQHSFCMEPCMDGLVDYVRRQVKCPECRAEHRIPYQGVQGFPTNVTLQRFLELHIEITGELPDPTSGQIMERCNVCSEKSYCSLCAHCEKKICEDCKGAHMDILRREISRINNQIRRGIHRLQDALSMVEKNTTSLQTNCLSVLEEVDEIYRRLQKALKDRTEHLRGEIDKYMTTEMKNLCTLRENLEQEIGNIQSNCDLADKYMTDAVEWDDCELMDTKEIFMKTVEFMRNFEYENSDYNRRVRFQMAIDPNQLVMTVANHGDLNIAPHSSGASPSQSGLLAPPGPALMRSKSDHRLATQFRQQEAQGFGVNADDEPLLGGRRFGERPVKVASAASDVRHSRGSEYDYDYENEPTSRTGKGRFRSRFVKSHHADTESDTESTKSMAVKEKEKDKIISTEDTSKGPLSGIFRIADSPRVMKRLQEQEMGKKEKKEVAPPQKPAAQTPKRPVAPVTARQLSEDDEIARIKRQNKGATSTAPVTPPIAVQVVDHSERPASERVTALKSRNTASDDSDHSTPSSPVRRTPPESARASTPATVKKTSRSASTDSNTSTESSSASSTTAAGRSGTVRPEAEVKAKTTPRTSIDNTPRTPPTPTETAPAVRSRAAAAAASSTEPTPATPSTPEKKPFQSRFLHSQQPKKEETESSSEEETSSEESEEEEEEEPAPAPSARRSTTTAPSTPPATTSASSKTREAASSPSLTRTRQDSTETRKSSREEPRSGYGSPGYKSSYEETPKYGTSSRETETSKYGRDAEPSKYSTSTRDTETSKYGRTRTTQPEPDYGSGSSYTSRFLNKSKSTAVVTPPADDDATGDDSDSRYGTGRTRYMAMKERRNRLARSRSTASFGNDDDDDEPVSPTTASPSAYLASRYGASSSYAAQGGSDLSRSRSSHALKSREPSPERGAGSSTDKNGAELSSWARYLKNKYGSRGKETPTTTSARESTSSTTPAQSSSHAAAQAIQRRLSLGLPLRQANEITSSDDDSKNGQGSPTSPTVAVGITGAAGMSHSPRAQYLQKRRQLFQLGGRGSEPGSFTWPRGIAVGPDNTIVVADSSNHRVQVFDSNGIFAKEFGQYGNANGEFDCLAGVAVNRIGQFIIADRYNHRIQVMDPSGRFLRAFGSQGTADGKFNYPWGITTDALGFIYVCDKENHRIQVFQSDGTFVGKFGTCGHNEGQLEHPHYIAVSNTNRVIVSDSNNHRIQIFDVNGRVLSTFGGEGSEEGQFKFPRGVAVDDQGYICVADSGNNRIQIFHPDGSFLRAFGSWGSGDAEFKGLEGVAIMSNGNILVCDRENHRVQVF